jgi:hypothetical protein
MTALWYTAPCNLVQVDRHFICAYCLHHQGDGIIHPDDEGSKQFWNVGPLLWEYLAQYHHWEPDMSLSSHVPLNSSQSYTVSSHSKQKQL